MKTCRKEKMFSVSYFLAVPFGSSSTLPSGEDLAVWATTHGDTQGPGVPFVVGDLTAWMSGVQVVLPALGRTTCHGRLAAMWTWGAGY